MTAENAVPGTPLKNMDTHKGNCASAPGWALKPRPTASATATMVMVRASGLSCMMMRMPLTMTTPNVRMTAPPNTGVGMTEQSALTLGHSPATTMMPPATATTWRLNTRVIPSRPTSALAEMVGPLLNRAENALVIACVKMTPRVSSLVGMRSSVSIVVADVSPRSSATPQMARNAMVMQASRGNSIPQCSGSGNANHAACSTGPKSTRPSAAASAKPTASPMSGAAPCRKPRPNTLNARTVSKVTPASR